MFSANLRTSKFSLPLHLLWIAALVFSLDFASKWFVATHLPKVSPSTYWYPYGGIPLFRDFLGIEFSINHITNTGAAWGLFDTYQLPLILLRLCLIAALALYLMYFNQRAERNIPLMLIITGALGNVIDFFLYGHVVDMLHVVLWGYDFPVFNIADSAISIGVIWLLILSFFEKQH